MLLDEKQARARLDNPNNLANRFGHAQPTTMHTPSDSTGEVESAVHHVPDRRPGNSRGARLSLEERTEIALDCLQPGRSQREIAVSHGVSVPEVSLINRGKVPIDAERIREGKDRALDRLMVAMGFLTDDKLSACKATDIASIAANMSRVVEKLMPKDDKPDQINFIIYSPELRQERSFDSVEI
jgi:hypothetical protein